MIKGKRKRKKKERKARLSFLFLQSIQASSMRIFTCLHMYVVCSVYGDGPLQRADAREFVKSTGVGKWLKAPCATHVPQCSFGVHRIFSRAVQVHIDTTYM